MTWLPVRFLSRSLAVLAVAVLTLGPAVPALAAETSVAEFAIIPADAVVEGDLYTGGIRVIVEGRVEGDLLAAAAEEVVVAGTVTGSVVAIAPRVVVTGEIGGSLRVLGGRLEVEGTVRGDVVQATGSTRFGPASEIEKEVLAWTGRMSALGSIGIDLTGSVGELELAGDVGRDVEVSASSVTVVDALTVAGDLGYRSDNEATGLANADVTGSIVKETPLDQNLRVRALGLMARLLLVIFLTISAITVVLSWPDQTQAAIGQLESKPIRAWLSGLGVFLLPALLVGMAALVLNLAPATAALPFLAVMIPLILATTGVVMMLALVAGVPAVTWFGGQLRKGASLNRAVAVGSLAAAVVWFLPAVGWLVPFLFLPLGMGSWLLSWRESGS